MYYPKTALTAPGLAAGYNQPNTSNQTMLELGQENLHQGTSTAVGAPSSPQGHPMGAPGSPPQFYGQPPLVPPPPGTLVGASPSSPAAASQGPAAGYGFIPGGMLPPAAGPGVYASGMASAAGGHHPTAAAQGAGAPQLQPQPPAPGAMHVMGPHMYYGGGVGAMQAAAAAAAAAASAAETEAPFPPAPVNPMYFAQMGYFPYPPPYYGYPVPTTFGPGPPIQTTATGQGPPGCNLFVFHIPNAMSNLDLYTLFKRFGKVVSARIMVERQTGRSRGFGFVSFDNRKDAERAIREMNGYQVGHKRLKVQLKKAKGEGGGPPSGGGGGGDGAAAGAAGVGTGAAGGPLGGGGKGGGANGARRKNKGRSPKEGKGKSRKEKKDLDELEDEKSAVKVLLTGGDPKDDGTSSDTNAADFVSKCSTQETGEGGEGEGYLTAGVAALSLDKGSVTASAAGEGAELPISNEEQRPAADAVC